jgi:peroxiredoxin
MNLKKELSDFAEQMSKQAPKEVLQTMGEEIQKLAQSGITESAKSQGDIAPDFELENSDGIKVSLGSLLELGNVVISFNRGNWCPFCNLEFKALQEAVSDIKEVGSNMVVISPQLPIMSRQLKQDNGFTYDILYDKGNEVAKQFGISFALSKSLRPIHDAFGMDIPAHNGDNSFELPLAATYVINKDRRIIYAYLNANWMERAEPEDFLTIRN